jgi:hypothetical protein
MIEKAKTDQPRSLEDTLLFAQHFYHTSSEDAFTVAKRIQALKLPLRGLFILQNLTTTIDVLEGGYAFEIRIQFLYRNLTIAKAVGQIYTVDGITVLDGKVRLSLLWYAALMFGVTLMLILLVGEVFTPSARLLQALWTSGTMAYYVYIIIKARDELQHCLEQTANTPDEKAKIA